MIEALVALGFGLLIGSFLNVCIYRLPNDLSVVGPRSYCPRCSQQIAWYDNVPLLSYIRLRGRCRHCGERISARYPVVELLTGALFFWFVMALGPTPLAGKYCLLSALLVGLIFTDLESMILPDEFTLGGTAAGLVLAWFLPIRGGLAEFALQVAGVQMPPATVSLVESAVGAAIPSFFLWLAGFLFEKIRHKEGLGLGDVKMLAALGAFLGVHGALVSFMIGAVLGSVVGGAYILIARKDPGSYPIPFGSFLGVAAIGVTVAHVGGLGLV
ncbi:MAG: prepilin peptidase [Acidobacteria bacterium]|nr:prepilin peptidase [Acidobacteriota bacterium]